MSDVVCVHVGDHFGFGRGDGRLATPEAARRRLRAWRDELGVDSVHWREVTTLAREFRYSARRGRARPRFQGLSWDELAHVPQLAHELGLRALLYTTLFDEGAPLPRRSEPGAGMRTIAWRSEFSRRHPEYAWVDRSGRRRHWGVLCLAYPEVRRHFQDRIRRLLAAGEWDGLFLCLRSQSRPPDHADRFGYNEPVLREYRERHGERFDPQAWRDLVGSHLTRFLRTLRDEVPILSVGVPRGDILGPPLGNATLAWPQWKGIVDELVINQNSSYCPARMHRLWPARRDRGYLQDYRTGAGLPPLLEHLNRYEGVLVSRQWDRRSREAERILRAHPSVRGLVFSSFRHDLPELCERDDAWETRRTGQDLHAVVSD